MNPKSGLSKDLRIGVVRGGVSSERAVSLRSGRAIRRALRAVGMRVRCLDPRNRRIFSQKILDVDLAFLALHGHGGEDGTIQTLLERLRVPYTGSDAHASRRAFDKSAAKRVFRRSGIPTPDSAVIRSGEDWEKKLEALGFPCFFKPLCDGSSIGVFQAADLESGRSMIRKSLRRYGALLAEKKIEGREFTVGILGARPLPVIELRPKNDFYDYHAKYTKGMTDYLVPAPIPGRLAGRLRRLGMRAHRALGLRDLSRVDIMVDRSGRPFVLEVNTIPGFTELSLLPKAAGAVGIGFSQLCCRLLAYAHRRGKQAVCARRPHG